MFGSPTAKKGLSGGPLTLVVRPDRRATSVLCVEDAPWTETDPLKLDVFRLSVHC